MDLKYFESVIEAMNYDYQAVVNCFKPIEYNH